jgi:trimeric autotransporter adhesin
MFRLLGGEAMSSGVVTAQRRCPRLGYRLALLGTLFLVLVALSAGHAAPAAAAPGDIGYEGPSTVGAGAATTGEKPESKLWWNDGFWWGSMWDAASSDFHIHRLNTATHSWVDTGVAIDNRGGTKADALWDGASGKLYVASHGFSNSSSSGTQARLYRYSYDTTANAYSLDSGFPVVIGTYKTEALVLAKDSTGQLWATWKQGSSVVVNRSVCDPGCNDAVWGTPFTPAVPGTSFSSDDISAVIAFGGNKVGLFWSNQNADADYFAVHADSDADTAWSGETALSGQNLADDHVNLKTDSSGRVYAAVKTSLGSSGQPLVLLLVRSASGTWSSHTFGLVRDHHTRPIVILDQAASLVRMYATSPETSGVIYEKTSPMASISFPTGVGTPVVKDADAKVNNVTSTKQNVDASTGLVLLASSTAGVYFHQELPIGGGGPSAPVAAFSGSPRTGTVPLTVQFTDESTGSPDSWAWDFQNDGTVDSTEQNPGFTYLNPGTYSVKLTVSNGVGPDSLTKTGYITVSPAGGQTLTFTPTDDAYVRSNAPNEKNGGAVTLRAYKSATAQTDSYLKFTVTGVTGSITSAALRLHVAQASPDGGVLYPVADTSWSESSLTWATRPPLGSTAIGAAGAVSTGTWIEIDLGSTITGDGTYSFALAGRTTPAAWYDSSEAASNRPQLVLVQS